jgi:hypothetical protein
MSIRILKYELPIQKEAIELFLHENMQIIHISNQDDDLFMWAIVNMDSKLIKRRFKILLTGDEIGNPDSMYMIQTVLMPNGYVGHVFEAKEND